MAGFVRKSVDAREETRAFEEGSEKHELVTSTAVRSAGRTSSPGWQSSKHVKAIAGTDRWMAARKGYIRVVAERLGDTPAVVLATYAHLWPDDDDRTRQAVDEVLSAGASNLRHIPSERGGAQRS
jgi:hypothetical protein